MEPDRPSTPPSSPSSTPSSSKRQRLERFAWLLDDAIKVPGMNYRVGFDALIGLIPGVGDTAGALLSSYILFEGARLGVSLATLLRMALNIGVETVVGAIPFLGDLFDFAFKANDRNVRLIERHLDAPDQTHRSSRTVLIVTVIALILFILGLVALSIWALRALIMLIAGAG